MNREKLENDYIKKWNQKQYVTNKKIYLILMNGITVILK